MATPTMAEDGVATLLKKLSQPLKPIPTGVKPSIRPLSGIKAVVFDIYGTLLCSGVGDISVDQATDRDPALRGAMEAVGIKVVSPGRFREAWVKEVKEHQGVRRQEGIEYPEVDICSVWKTFLEKIRAEGLIEGSWDETTLRRVSVEYECRVNPAWPMPDFKSILSALTSEHFRLGIISNAQFFTPRLIEVLAGEHLEDLGFDLGGCIWSYQLLEAKPSTVLYEQSANYWKSRYHIAPEAVLYVGNDLLNDIWPAQQVGFKTALFAGDARSLRMREGDARVAGVEPDIILTGLDPLIQVLHS